MVWPPTAAEASYSTLCSRFMGPRGLSLGHKAPHPHPLPRERELEGPVPQAVILILALMGTVGAAAPLCAPISLRQAPGPFAHLHTKTSWSYSSISCWQPWLPTSARGSTHDLGGRGLPAPACSNSWKCRASVCEHACADLGKSEPGSIMCHRGCAERERHRRFPVLWRFPWQTFSALA